MSNKKNDGGPAFPRPASEYEPNGLRIDGIIAAVPYNGMTLRDYYIAHAPAEPQPWFKPVMLTKRPEPQFPEGSRRDFDVCLNIDQLNTWESEYKKQHYIQWPAAWADAMIAQR